MKAGPTAAEYSELGMQVACLRVFTWTQDSLAHIIPFWGVL